MSMAQDFSQHFQPYGGEAQVPFHQRRPSMLATTYGYKNVSTNAAASLTGSQSGSSGHCNSWQGQLLNSSSPSIWSNQYSGDLDWPASSHDRQPSASGTIGGPVGGYSNLSNPTYVAHQHGEFNHTSATTNQHRQQQQQHVVPQPQHHRSYSAFNPMPVQLVQGFNNIQQPVLNYNIQPVVIVPHPQLQYQPMSQVPPPQPVQDMPHHHQQIHQIQQQQQLYQQQHMQQQQQQFQHLLQAPRLMPHYIHPVVPSQAPVYQRAPCQAPPSDNSSSNSANTVPDTGYDIQKFAKFLLSVSIGIVEDDLSPDESEKFECFIETMLCATRLQLSTLFMGLVFLNRTNKLSGSIFQTLSLRKRLVCSLILANKMHDDNTFTNASWSIVSGIPTKEITSLEAQCLKAFEWDLSMGDSGMSEWQYWQNCWNEFLQKLQSPIPVNSPPFSGTWGVNMAPDNFTIAAAC